MFGDNRDKILPVMRDEVLPAGRSVAQTMKRMSLESRHEISRETEHMMKDEVITQAHVSLCNLEQGMATTIIMTMKQRMDVGREACEGSPVLQAILEQMTMNSAARVARATEIAASRRERRFECSR